ERIAELDLPDREKHLLIFRPGANIEMPNPFSYITDPNFWSATRRIICPRTSTHGDLHGGNIICRPGATPIGYQIGYQGSQVEDTSHVPWLIDFAQFSDNGLPFFDLAYLEVDLLLRSLPCEESLDSWGEWLSITTHLSDAVLPKGDPVGRRSSTAWHLVE